MSLLVTGLSGFFLLITDTKWFFPKFSKWFRLMMLAHDWHILVSADGCLMMLGKDLGIMWKFISSCLDKTILSRTDGVSQNLQTLVVFSILTRTFVVPDITIDCSLAAQTLDVSSFSSRISACFATLLDNMETSLPVSGQQRAILHESAVFLLDFAGAIRISRLSVLENISDTAVILPLAQACIEDIVYSDVSPSK